MRFLDSAKIFVASGAGGAGGVSFRREKFVPRGGPDGGDGGRGGAVIVKAVANLNTLIDFRYQQHFRAGTGETGKGGNRHGKKGKDLMLAVPVGTQIYDEHGEELLADLTEVDQQIVLARGGKGGRGNAYFKSATNQAPRFAEAGGAKQEFYVWLKLKLLADIGLVGMPNAGKSSLLNALTMAKSKVGDYPFTTLYPALGVLSLSYQDIVLADIPGLIAGAAEGKGLGHRFLGHVERTRMILHLLDVTENDLALRYRAVQQELAAYDVDLVSKPQLVVLSKIDQVDQEYVDWVIAALAKEDIGVDHAISSFSKQGLSSLIGWFTHHYADLLKD